MTDRKVTDFLFFCRVSWGTSCKGTAQYWKMGWGAIAHLQFKETCTKTACFSFNSFNSNSRHFQNDIINYLWGVHELKLHRHILGRPETYINILYKIGITGPLIRYVSWAPNQHIIIFLKDHVILKTWVMMEIQLCHHRNKLHFKIYWIKLF